MLKAFYIRKKALRSIELIENGSSQGTEGDHDNIYSSLQFMKATQSIPLQPIVWRRNLG